MKVKSGMHFFILIVLTYQNIASLIPDYDEFIHKLALQFEGLWKTIYHPCCSNGKAKR